MCIRGRCFRLCSRGFRRIYEVSQVLFRLSRWENLGHFSLEAVPSLPARAFLQDCSNSCTSPKSPMAKM